MSLRRQENLVEFIMEVMTKKTLGKNWKRLIDMGVFVDSFSQRVSASFQYLDTDDQGYFSLKEFTALGKFVFNYLSMNASTDTSFAIMDVFRRLDRQGTGKINIENFVLGIIERVFVFYMNENILDSIAYEIIPYGTIRCNDLIGSVNSSSTSASSSTNMFASYFAASSYLVRQRLEAFQNSKLDRSEREVMINTDAFKALLEQVAHDLIFELKNHFHISTQLLRSTLSDVADAEFDLDSLIGKIDKKSLTSDHETMVVSISPTWNFRGFKGHTRDSQGSIVFTAGRSNSVHLPATKKKISFSGMGTSGGDGSGSAGGVDTASLSPRRPRSQSTISDRDRDREQTQSISQGGDTGSNAGDAVNGAGTSGSLSVAESSSHLGPLSLGEVDVTFLQGADWDDSKLFLLQTAFRSLNNFFSLVRDPVTGLVNVAIPSDELGIPALAPLPVVPQSTVGKTASKDPLLSSSKQGDGLPFGPIIPAKCPSLPITSSVESSTVGPVAATGATTGLRGLSAFEAELAKHLAQTQDELRRARMRIEILEMVQMTGEENITGFVSSDALRDSMVLEAYFQGGNNENGSLGDKGEPERKDGHDPGEREEGVAAGAGGSLRGMMMKLGNGVPSHTRTASSSHGQSSQLGHDSSLMVVAFEDILREIGGLKASLAERGNLDMALGRMIDVECGIVPMYAPAYSSISSLVGSDLSGGGSVLSGNSTSAGHGPSVSDFLRDLDHSGRTLQESLKRRIGEDEKREAVAFRLEQQEEVLSELYLLREQQQQERSQLVTANIEAQMLREKVVF